jgi:hypothetical protein
MLVARSVAEAHLYLDLRGASRSDRPSRLELRGDDLVTVYEADCEGVRRRFEFLIPNPEARSGTYGDGEPSTVIGPGEFLAWSDHVARTVPADPAGLGTADRAEARRRLEVAADCVEEVVKFIPADADTVPADAFRSAFDQSVRELEPGRFSRDRLTAIAQTYRRLAAGF